MSLIHATLEEVLDDLSSRFVINLPEEELESVERIGFQIENAFWFYDDFIREHNPALPKFTLKTFSAKFFQHCPLLQRWAHEHERAYKDFLEYKTKVPVCGAILLDDRMQQCVLVKGWHSRSGWSFPKGKINKDEPEYSCAIREVYEETGFDISRLINQHDYIDTNVREQQVRLYIVCNVPKTTVFVPQTRKEISKIGWHAISDLPTFRDREALRKAENNSSSGSNGDGSKNFTRYYMVMPFMGGLNAWINNRRKTLRQNGAGAKRASDRKMREQAAPVTVLGTPLYAARANADGGVTAHHIHATKQARHTGHRNATHPQGGARSALDKTLSPKGGKNAVHSYESAQHKAQKALTNASLHSAAKAEEHTNALKLILGIGSLDVNVASGPTALPRQATTAL